MDKPPSFDAISSSIFSVSRFLTWQAWAVIPEQGASRNGIEKGLAYQGILGYPGRRARKRERTA